MLLEGSILNLIRSLQYQLDKIDDFEFLKHLGTWKYYSIDVIVSTVFSGYNDTFKAYWTFGHVSTELCREGKMNQEICFFLTKVPMYVGTLGIKLS